MDLFPSELVDTAASALPLDKQGSKEESCQKAFPFNKMLPNMLDPEMIEDTVKIANEAVKDKVQVNLIINNRAGGNAPLIAQTIADRLQSQEPKRLF